ncbi:MAG: hypothetical protein JNL01_15750 [Bdellovibrionales bacterium]|nr:hypothetical protein [Bdellovibrionales bacterium]
MTMIEVMHNEEGDINLIEMWLKIDPTRWIAGAMGGLTAGWIAMAVAMIFSAAAGLELYFPIKAVAAALLGSSATESGMHIGAILTGAIGHSILAAVLGVAYAHFSVKNHLSVLLGTGFVWGTFSWVFIFCLFSQSFQGWNALALHRGAGLALNLVFGFSLATVAVFDKMLRKN